MASKAAQTEVIKCQICDGKRCAHWSCTMCQIAVCNGCMDSHLVTKKPYDHKLIPLASTIERAKGIVIPRCKKHQNEEVQMYCKKCRVLFCHDCIIIGEHKRDNYVKLSKVIEEKQEEYKVHISDLKEKLSSFEEAFRELEEGENVNFKMKNQSIESATAKHQQLKSELDKIFNHTVSQIQRSHKKKLERSSKMKTEWQNESRHIEQCIELFENFEHIQNLDIIRIVDCLKDLVTKFRRCPKSLENTVIGFIPSSENNQFLQESFGKATENDVAILERETTSIKVSTTYDFPDSWIGIRPIDGTHAWIDSNGTSLDLVSITGNTKMKIEHKSDDFQDFIVTTEGDIFFTEKHAVKEITKNEIIQQIKNTAPYEAGMLCLTSQRDILVCLYKETKKGLLRSKKIGGKIERISVAGETKQTIQFDLNNKELFSLPFLIAENINQDVCVVNWNSLSGGLYNELVVVTSYGYPKFRYHPTNVLFHGLACDKIGHILVVDTNQNNIHQLDNDGKFIQYILGGNVGIEQILGISIDPDGKLWINDNNEEIKVLKYLSYK